MKGAHFVNWLALQVLLLLLSASAANAQSLPEGTVLTVAKTVQPREVFISELSGGKRPLQSILGELLFRSPFIFGGLAQHENLSCHTCHQEGTTNPDLFVPGLSTRRGTFDTTGALFNPKTDDGVLNALRIPSLRGIKQLAPYGQDGRFGSLREATRHVIVNEFAGREPSPAVLDALISYLYEIAFLGNPRIASDGMLTEGATAAELRGQSLFLTPLAPKSDGQAPRVSCASCHIPSAGFVDHVQHDIGTGAYKTPTLRNANLNAPYFHDGRFNTFEEVVEYKDMQFKLGLSAQDKADLVAYLRAVGAGERPFETSSVRFQDEDITFFLEAVNEIVSEENADLAPIVVQTLAHEFQQFAAAFPEDRIANQGSEQRAAARKALGDLVAALDKIRVECVEGRWASAKQEMKALKPSFQNAMPTLLAAEPWSLFNPAILEQRKALAETHSVPGQ